MERKREKRGFVSVSFSPRSHSFELRLPGRRSKEQKQRPGAEQWVGTRKVTNKIDNRNTTQLAPLDDGDERNPDTQREDKREEVEERGRYSEVLLRAKRVSFSSRKGRKGIGNAR
jgi:hypothetical protein